MRAGPLSEARVQALAGGCFVPAWVSRDRYQLGAIPEIEKRWLAHLDASKKKKRLAGGAVCVYLATADGECLASLPVPAASKPGALASFLKEQVRALRLKPDSRVKPAPPLATPAPAGSRRFIVRTKLDGRANRGTSRDVIDLPRAKWKLLLPPAGVKSHEVPRPVAEALLRFAYPPLPTWDARLAKVEVARLRVTAEGGKLRIEGRVRIIYPHRGKPDDGVAEARLSGIARLTPGGDLAEWVVASESGSYTWHWAGKAIPRTMRVAIEMDAPPLPR